MNCFYRSDCDTGRSHVYWVQNLNKGATWSRHQLPDPPTADGDVPGTGLFHSLSVADFDKDGDLDGDIDIVTQVWNKDGVYNHADYGRNDVKS